MELLTLQNLKNSTINTPTSISYTWDNVPTTVGSTYLRLRIQSNVAGDPSEPYDIRMGGETEDYMVKITSFITGNVFNDLNGVDNNSNIVDGNLISEIESSPLFISIIKNGDYIGQVPVAPDGSYEIGEIDEANYELILTTIENSTTPHLGSNWEYMGENIGDSSGHDGEKNGKIIVTIVNNSPEINEVNFGINKRPDTDSKHTTIPSPRTGDTLKIGINTLPGLTGSDFEDGDYANLNGESADPSGIRITTLPFNGVLYYDGTPVTVNQFIPSMEMGDLYIILTGTDYISTSFNYAYIDGAGLEDLSPATYTIEWSSLLPVSLKSFEAIALPEITLITWETASETNNKGFEVERSLDGINWDKLIFISTKSKNGFSNTPLTYSYSDDILNGEVYYRLKQIDYSGEIEYSHIRSITRENQMIAKIFPNPVTDDLRIEGIHNSKSIRIYSALGALVNSIQINNENELQLSMGKMPKGLYIVEITGNDNSINNYKLIKN